MGYTTSSISTGKIRAEIKEISNVQSTPVTIRTKRRPKKKDIRPPQMNTKTKSFSLRNV